ncbi:MAG: Gfo/Idh/MocA family protein [Limisphaerales bacterium]
MNTSSNRRSFLRRTTLALAVPTLLPSRVFGAATPPSERIRLGFIGVGTQGRYLLGNCLKRPNVVVTAVADVDTTRRENGRRIVREHYAKEGGSANSGTCQAFVDFRDLLARPDIDAVVIATPDHWHAFVGILAAKAGKDIYCEKPLTQTIHEARALVRTVRKHRRVFQVGSMQRSSREFRRACQLVRNGAIGTIQNVEVGVGGPGRWCDLPTQPSEPGLDWNLWLGPAPWRGYNAELSPRGVHTHFPNWRSYREYGGGMITDWGAHHFDIVQWALGMDESGPIEVIPPSAPNAQSGVQFRYANGVPVVHIPGNGITFHGSEGRIHVNRGRFESTPESLVEIPLESHKIQLQESNDHIGNWLECVATRKRPICDVEVGARTVTVCHLANLAYWNRRRLEWDPKAEAFVNGQGDNSWRDRNYRDPWSLSRVLNA